MLTEGGAYAFKKMQTGATATGDGYSMTPLTINGGSYALLTAQVVGISGDTITWEGTIDEENWVALPALNVATRAIATTATADGIYRLVVTSLVAVRARISTYGAGTIWVYGLLTASGEPGFLAEGGGEGTTDHAALTNLDYASSGHTGFEASGTAAAAIVTHVGLADPHTGYLLADGTRAGASSQAQTFTNGVVTGKVYPSADSTNAFGLYRADGTTQDFYYDSNSRFFGFGVEPTRKFHIKTNGNTAASTGFLLQNSSGTNLYQIRDDGSFVYAGHSISNTYFEILSGGEARARMFSSGATATNDALTYYVNGGTASNCYAELSLNRTTSASAAAGASVALDTRGGIAPLRLFVKAPSATPVDALDIFSNTNVGIGTNNSDTGARFSVLGSVSATNTVGNHVWLQRDSTGAAAAGFGLGIVAKLESSTTTGQDAGRLTWEWVTATHASRASRGKLSAYAVVASVYTEQNAMTWDGDPSGLKLAFYGGTPVAKAAAYTQTYSTADRTLSAYTADNESGAYTGIDNAQAGSVYATLTDLNALRTAYENLRAFVEDIAGMLNSTVDDLQALNLVG